MHRLDQLDSVVADSLITPNVDDYDGHQRRLFDHYVEIQLWTDAPIRQYVSR